MMIVSAELRPKSKLKKKISHRNSRNKSRDTGEDNRSSALPVRDMS